MKKYLYILVVLAGFQISATAQDCDSLVTICESYLDQKDGGLFISDGQVYQAFLTEEAAEEKFITSADNLFSAISKDNFVLVEFSKNKLATVISLNDGTFLIG